MVTSWFREVQPTSSWLVERLRIWGDEKLSVGVSRSAAERFRWAVEVLDPAPSDRLLEIGCGAGVAVSLICPHLSGGTIVAIDRSKSMVERAVRRNAGCVEAGRASFEAIPLGDADFWRARFDAAFAINVHLFRADARRELDVLRRALKPTGALYLFQQHPSASRTRTVTEELRAALTTNAFGVREVRSKGSGASTMTCIVAAPLGPAGEGPGNLSEGR
jgi:SAM-dependent methyltransferase